MTYFSRKEHDETAEEYMERVLGYKTIIQQLTTQLDLNETLQINSFLSKPFLDVDILQGEDENSQLADVTQRVNEACLDGHGIVPYEDSDSSDSDINT